VATPGAPRKSKPTSLLANPTEAVEAKRQLRFDRTADIADLVCES